MGFYETLEEFGYTQFLQKVVYESPNFVNLENVLAEIQTIVSTNAKVLIFGDYDVDGLMCIRILKEGLHLLGARNVDVFRYRKRMHSLDALAVQQCIQGNYKYCIIADCGSNNISLLHKLLDYGIKVILLDHHKVNITYDDYTDYSSDIAVINTMLEPVEYSLSAGALCYCVMHEACSRIGVEDDGLSVYALISLYADCMCMSDRLNRSIYYNAVTVDRSKIPADVTMMMNQYQVISSRFINYWFAPRINAMFRAENLELINKLFIEDIPAKELSECLETVEELYTSLRAMVDKISDVIEVTEMDTFVVANVQSVDKIIDTQKNKLWNYTGLIANKLTDRYSKTAFVYCYNGDYVKGSVRDVYGRDLLSSFSQLCRAEGHPPAFGTQVQILDIDSFLEDLKRLDKNLQLKRPNNKPVILQYNYATVDKQLVEDVALINEFASPGVPVVLIRKQKIGQMPEYKTTYDYRYNWDGMRISASHAVSFGTWMLLRPCKGLKTKLILQ